VKKGLHVYFSVGKLVVLLYKNTYIVYFLTLKFETDQGDVSIESNE